jgi:hypothetical protein
MIRIRAFKAISEPESCIKYAEGHLQVLKEFDIAMVSPLNLDWINDPNTYIITAESIASRQMLGGALLQVNGGKRKLPIVNAIKEVDDRVAEIINSYGITETGEFFGAWNSKEIAGYGIGIYYLALAAITIAPKLNLKTLFALCSPYTVDHYTKFGFEVTTFLGNNGIFFYPKKDLTAIGMVLLNCNLLEMANGIEKDTISLLRENPRQVIPAEGKHGKYDIHFNLGM